MIEGLAHQAMMQKELPKSHFPQRFHLYAIQNPTDKRIQARLARGEKGRMPYSWFYFDLVKNVSKDKTFHSCQIPTPLVEMFIKSCTNEGDSVFVLFGGSGGEILLCENLGRKWLSCELHKPYFEMINDRLQSNGAIKNEFRLPNFVRKESVSRNAIKDSSHTSQNQAQNSPQNQPQNPQRLFEISH